MQTLTVHDIIEKAGGPNGLHEASKKLVTRQRGGRTVKGVAEKTIHSWFKSGIPEWHWQMIKDVCGVTEVELHAANELVRAEERKLAKKNAQRRSPTAKAQVAA